MMITETSEQGWSNASPLGVTMYDGPNKKRHGMAYFNSETYFTFFGVSPSFFGEARQLSIESALRRAPKATTNAALIIAPMLRTDHISVACRKSIRDSRESLHGLLSTVREG